MGTAWLGADTVERLRLQADGTFSDDLGSFGETVPPRAGEIARKQRDKEDFCLRRLLIAWRAKRLLRLPLKVRALCKVKGTEGWPDYVLTQNVGLTRDDGFELGIEVTESADPGYQKELTREDKEFNEKGPRTGVHQFVLINNDGYAGEEPERLAVSAIRTSISHKEEKLRSGNYKVVKECDLLVYENSRTGWFSNPDIVLERLRSEREGEASASVCRFRQIHLMIKNLVYLDIFGDEPKKVDLSATYDADLAGWALEQARLARSDLRATLDLPNLAEEIEYLGRSRRRARDSHLYNLMMHMLKWAFQPEMRSKSWQRTIFNCRLEIERLVEESPSLDLAGTDPAVPMTVIVTEYRRARQAAANETGLSIVAFPETCPWPVEQILDFDFLPEDDGGPV